MSTPDKISPDDPRLTTYALGEMEPAERAEFEQLLKQDAAGRALVAEINRTAHNIGVALTREELPQAGEASLGQAAIIPGRNPGKIDGGSLRTDEVPNLRRGLAKVFQFPQLYFTISGLAAACFAVGFVVWQAGYHPQPQVQYTEVDLTKLSPVNAKNTAEAEGGLQPVPIENEVGVVPLENNGSDNVFLAAASEPQSTFPIKTGIAAYANVLQLIKAGRLPPRDAVRIEEMVNHFRYQYEPPESKSTAPLFAAHLEVASAPWAPEHRLVRIGLKGRETQKLQVSLTGEALPPIAKDVKILVEFNPAQVQAYRLIGYENPMRRKEDFENDRIDAGEVGAGHMVTALYEVVPAGAKWTAEGSADGLKYHSTAKSPVADIRSDGNGGLIATSDALLTLKMSYLEPAGEESKKLEFPLRESGHTFDQASADFQFAASVAAFGMILRDSPHKGNATFAHVREWAGTSTAANGARGFRGDFMELVGQAERLSRN